MELSDEPDVGGNELFRWPPASEYHQILLILHAKLPLQLPGIHKNLAK